MSWNILPKSNLQYFLTKLKSIFDKKVDKETGKGLFSGSYNDLTNKPTIPAAANNNTITIQLNGVTVESFTLNQATDETINIQVTKSSVGLGNVGNFKAVSTEASQGLTDTEKSNARANIGAGTSSTDQKVYQENTNINTDYRVLLGVANDITSYVYKSIGLRYNPGKDSVYTEKINDIMLGDAIGYDVQDNSSASDLTNAYLPTGQTIKSYLNSNLYINTVTIGTSIGTYSDNALYTALRNNSGVKNRVPCFFIVEAAGGIRFGFCLLYGNTKEYGSIMVMHYSYSPRVFRIDNGVITLSSWATT